MLLFKMNMISQLPNNCTAVDLFTSSAVTPLPHGCMASVGAGLINLSSEIDNYTRLQTFDGPASNGGHGRKARGSSDGFITQLSALQEQTSRETPMQQGATEGTHNRKQCGEQ